jgi:fatty acid desaturase
VNWLETFLDAACEANRSPVSWKTFLAFIALMALVGSVLWLGFGLA